jgi:hypothetical protein
MRGGKGRLVNVLWSVTSEVANDELQRQWTKAVIAQLKVIWKHSLGWNEENHGKP